jgi:hypothetical protein
MAVLAALLLSSGALAMQAYTYSGGTKVVHCGKEASPPGFVGTAYKAMSDPDQCSRIAAKATCNAASGEVVVWWHDQGRTVYAPYAADRICTTNGGVFVF